MWSNLVKANVSSALNNAWDDDDYDDDDEDDLDEIAVDDQEVLETPEPPPPPPEPSSSSRFAAAASTRAGMFSMGRLTRLIEHVTQPDADAEEEEYSPQSNNSNIGEQLGWEEGDTSLGLDNTSGWQDEDVDLDLSDVDQTEEPAVSRSVAAAGAGPVEGAVTVDNVVVPDNDRRVLELCNQLDRIDGQLRTEAEAIAPALAPCSPQPSTTHRTVTMMVVDHTPPVTPQRTLNATDIATATASAYSGGISLVALAESEDLTRDSGANDDNFSDNQEDIFDNENELDFGPIVDHTPTSTRTTSNITKNETALSRQNSLAVQADTVMEDDGDDDVDDGWGEDDLPNSATTDLAPPMVEALVPPVVDHTPNDREIAGDKNADEEEEERMQQRRKNRSMSVSVLLSESGGSTARLAQTDGMDEEEQFGPVVDHTPLAATDTVKSAVATLSGTNSVAVQALALEEDYLQDDAMDETLYGDSTVDGCGTAGGAWEQDDADLDDLDDNFYTTTTSTEEQPVERHQARQRHPIHQEPRDENHVVDHTPDDEKRSVLIDPSVVVLVAQEDISRDTGDGNDEDVYDDENELIYGPVVDLTPPTPGNTAQSVMSGTNSMAVQAGQLLEELQEDDAMDDTAFPDDGDTTTRDGWEQDDLVLDDDLDDNAISKGSLERNEEKLSGVAMVDHTPSEMGSPPLKVNDPSVDVLNSTSTKDVDSAGATEFGPVVDHTPTTPASSTVPRSDSVVVQVQDLDTVDETYADEQEEAEEDGDDKVDLQMPMHVRSHEAQLVDYIPNAPESRYGDASTMVAADLSEVLSEVDDMAPEEGNFGPVVDVTPPNRPVAAAAGSPSAAESVAANSTAVFAPPSVAADDLDGDEETVTRGDQSAWDNQEEAPNPQSGNDEPANRLNEQLVDFLPPADEDETNDHESSLEGREPSSEVTVGGAQSLLQPLDPKEDDFGPVVDLTPTTRLTGMPSSGHSLASTATQVTASECRALEKEDIADGAIEDTEHLKGEVVVDKLPQSQVRFPMDSTGSVLGSQLAEDEEEDDSKFGPVVDHLPTPRASLAPSRGGSTVDALATVSEVGTDDDDGGEGWDDDIDVSESGISDRSALQKAAASQLAFRQSSTNDHERSVSVRFEITVDDGREEGRSSEGLSQTQYFDPEMGTNLEETQYFDPSSGGRSAWEDDVEISGSPELDAELSTKSFADADTPPSTPYRRPEPWTIQPHPAMLQEDRIWTECQSCIHAKTIECPCIRRLLKINSDSGSLIGTMRTPEGETVQVNFSKLLQDEMTKRILVQKESEALRSTMELQQIDGAFMATKESELESLVAALQKDKELLQQTVAQLQSALASVDGERDAIKDELDTSRQSLSDVEQKKANWSAKESSLEAQVTQLKESLESATARLASDGDVADMMTSLQSDLASKSGECEELNSQLMHIQLRLEDSEVQRNRQQQIIEQLSQQLQHTTSDYQQTVGALSRQLKESQDLLHEKAESDSRKIADLNAEVECLSTAKDDLLKTLGNLHQQHEEEMKQKYTLLDKKSAEIRALESVAKSFESEKPKMLSEIAYQRSLAEQSEALAAELLSVAKERDLLQIALSESKDAVVSFQQLIDEHGIEQEATESRRDAEISSLKTDLVNAAEAIRSKNSELAALSASLSRQTKEKDEAVCALEQLQLLHQSLQADAAQTRTAYEEEQGKCRAVSLQVSSLQSHVSQLTADVQNVESERKKSVSHLAALGRTLERAEKDAKSQAARAAELDGLVARLKNELGAVSAQRDDLMMKTDELLQRCRDVEANASRELEAADIRIQNESNRFRQEIQALMANQRDLREQLEAKSLSVDALVSERDDVASRCRELENQMARAGEQAQADACHQSQTHHEMVEGLQGHLQQLEMRVSEQRRSAEVMTTERNNLLSRCRELEARSKDASDESSRRLQEMSHSHELRLAELRDENAHLSNRMHELSTLRGELERLLGEVERLTRNREVLTEENEELLVQLGLFKQQIDTSEDQVRVLQEEVVARDELVGRVDELAEENAQLSFEIERLKADVNGLVAEKQRLEQTVDFLQSNSRDGLKLHEDGTLAANGIKGAEHRIQQLEEHCRKQQVEIESLRHGQHASSISSTVSFEQRIQQLESACASKDQELVAIATELTDLKSQLAISEGMRMSAEQILQEKDGRIRELEMRYAESKDRLNFARDQLTAAEATFEAEEKLPSFEAALEDLEKHEEIANHAIRKYEQRMKELEAELNQKNLMVARLEDSVSKLQFQLESWPLQMPRDLGAVHEHPEKYKLIEGLTQQLETVSGALHSTRMRLSEKEAEFDCLRAEMTQAQAQTQSQPQVPEIHVSHIRAKSSDTDIENLRSHIVSLAVALERSETKRAEAISRLMTERESNARSLKRLSDSLKRYYHNVSNGDV